MRALVVGRSYFTGNSFHIFVLIILLLIALPASGIGSTPYYDIDTRTPVQNPGIAKQCTSIDRNIYRSPGRKSNLSTKTLSSVMESAGTFTYINS